MPRTAAQILKALEAISNQHEELLDSLIDDASRELLHEAILAENRAIEVFVRRIAGLEIGDAQQILSSPANRIVAEAIARAMGLEIEAAWGMGGKDWVLKYLPNAYQLGIDKILDIATEGSGMTLHHPFSAEDAMVLQTAITKGYGKELGGLGKIKQVTQETENAIREIFAKAIRQRWTVPQLQGAIIKDSGLTSISGIDKNGRPYTVSLQRRAKLIAQNEISQIHQLAGEEKARDILGEDPWWYYGSVYEPERMTDWCKKRYGKVYRLSQWTDPDFVKARFGDGLTGTGHIHINCRQTGHAVDPDWFDEATQAKVFEGDARLLAEEEAKLLQAA